MATLKLKKPMACPKHKALYHLNKVYQYTQEEGTHRLLVQHDEKTEAVVPVYKKDVLIID